jgi:hypothetical protein
LTFKELKKFLDSRIDKKPTNEPSFNYNVAADKFCIFANKPFWIEHIREHRKADIANKGNCCFNHIIGLPKKDGIEHKIYDYEMDIWKDKLFHTKHLATSLKERRWCIYYLHSF